MPRLIDGDALSEKMYHEAFETDSDMQRWDSGCWIRYKMFENAIDSMPTIEAEPKRKTGKWIHQDFGGWHCSECGKQAPFWCFASTQQLGAYCQNCGAEMEKGENDAEKTDKQN